MNNNNITAVTADQENTFSFVDNSDLSIPQSAMSQDSYGSFLSHDQADLFTSVFAGISVPVAMNSSTMATTTVPVPHTSTSTGSGTWQNYSLSSTNTSLQPVIIRADNTAGTVNPTLDIKGNMIAHGSITLKDGSDLEQRLQAIEQRLGIMRRNAEFEEASEELKELAERYQTVSDRIQHRVNTWKKLASD